MGLLDNLKVKAENASRLEERYKVERFEKKEHTNYSIPGKFRTLLKFHLSNQVYKKIGKYPRITKERETKKLSVSSKRVSENRSEGFSDDLGLGDLPSHKISRKRVSKGYGTDEEETIWGNEENYKPNSMSRTDRVINREKLKENLAIKTEFKKRKAIMEKRCAKRI